MRLTEKDIGRPLAGGILVSYENIRSVCWVKKGKQKICVHYKDIK